jgi:hypothetical protein
MATESETDMDSEQSESDDGGARSEEEIYTDWNSLLQRLRSDDDSLVTLDLSLVLVPIAGRANQRPKQHRCHWYGDRDWNAEAWLELASALAANTNTRAIMWEYPSDDSDEDDFDGDDIRFGLMNPKSSAALVAALPNCNVLSLGSRFLEPGIVMELVGAKIKPLLVRRTLAAVAANDACLKALRIGDVWVDRFSDTDADQLCTALAGNTHLQSIDGSALGYQHELSGACLERFGRALAGTNVVWVSLPDIDNHHLMHEAAYPRCTLSRFTTLPYTMR